MILQKDYYKRNAKTGDIIKRQKIWVRCDECGDEHETLYEYVKYKAYAEDLCVSCRNRRNANGKIYQKKKEIICTACGKSFKRSFKLVKDFNFCSRLCYDKWYLSKYNHLWKNFDAFPDEVAYLCGLILGDGNLKKCDQKSTTRIRIAFDCHWGWTLGVAEGIFKKLGIDYRLEPKIQANCQQVGFVLPDKLLEKYGINFVGNKYDAQPSLVGTVSCNINFIAGMINSDGWCNFIRKKYETIRIVNTVSSIIESCRVCFDKNNIEYRFYHYPAKIDKRNGNLNKSTYLLVVCKKRQIENLRQKSVFRMKEPVHAQNSGK